MPIYHTPEGATPLTQGDIFRDVPYWRPHRKTTNDAWPSPTQRGNIVLDLQTASYAVLATQTCDISRAKDLLFVVATPAEELVRILNDNEENPISEQEFRNWIVRNLHPRYHFFEQFMIDEQIVIPEMVVNFRRAFTVRTEYIVEKLIPDGHRVLCIEEIYRAEFGNRFGQYYARVATERNMQSF